MRLNSLTSTIALAVLCACAWDAAGQVLAAGESFTLERKIPLGDVRGRIDHLSADLARHRLFVAELGNGSVSVVDFGAGDVVKRITGLREPQGVLYLPSTDTLYVALGGEGTLVQFAGETFEPSGSLEVGFDADNIHADPAGARIAVGFANGLALVDPASGQVTISIPLSGHAEGFAFDPSGQRAYVNIPESGEIAAVDLAAGNVADRWPTGVRGGNFPMAVDADRILVGFRSSASLGVYSTATGALEANLPICDDSDDLFADAQRQLVYVICGAGEIQTLTPDGAGYRPIATTPTAPGARTGLFVPELDRLFVAVRASAGTPAGVWVFAPSP